MNNQGCAIVMKEAKFESNELFFSITDDDSTIISGNEVFVRISGYAKSELVGQFHNIIRHPDMPRVVFKTFWDFLKADKPVVAYVKNKTKEGGYYWVLAAVFPLKDRYVSIRIKPSSSLFPIVRELYFKLLMAENRGGMEESGILMASLLKELGFESYEHFMSRALLSELLERQKNNNAVSMTENEKGDDLFTQLLGSLLEISQTLMKRYDKWFDKIELFIEVKQMFTEKGIKLRHLARDIVFLSLNASVASYKVASGGETFGVLASDIRINAKENDALITRIDSLAQSLSETLNEMIFTVSATRIQMEMIIYFLQESCIQNNMTECSELGNNLKTLVDLAQSYTLRLATLQTKMDQNIQECLKNLDQLEQQMMYLGYIQVYGLIEAASNSNETIGFGGIFYQLKDLIHSTSDEIVSLHKIGLNFSAENQALIRESHSLAHVIDEMEPKMAEIRKAA